MTNNDDTMPVSSAVTPTNNTPQAIIPNVLRNYTSYNAIVTFQVADSTRFNDMINSNTYYPAEWNTICRSGGVGPDKATGFSVKQYFTRDLFIDDVDITTICGLTYENKGGNAMSVEFTINEPFGMDLIEQLYDFCHDALQEKNYLDLGYLLKISFMGQLLDGTIEEAPGATKYIPIRLANMEIKLSNMGAIYKVTAIPYNEVAASEEFGRVVSTIELGSNQLFLQTEAINVLRNTNNVSVADISVLGVNKTSTSVAQGTAAIFNPTGDIAAVINAFLQCLNNQQLFMQNQPENKGYVADEYSVVFVNRTNLFKWDNYGFGSNGKGNHIGVFPFDMPDVASVNNPPSGQHDPMGAPTSSANQFNVFAASKNYQKYIADASGHTSTGVTYGNNKGGFKVTFNAGSDIISCLNTIISNSGYIIEQFRTYDNTLKDINAQIAALGQGAPIPAALSTEIDNLQQQPLNWFLVKPQVTILGFDYRRNVYAKKIVYYIKPYDIYNCKSFIAPNGNPSIHGRVVKEYDYMFTGKNTEIISFDIEFSAAFLVYSQFNNTTKSLGSGASSPDAQPLVAPIALATESSPVTAGQVGSFVSASSYDTSSVGITDADRNKVADVAATIYSKGDQIQLNMTVYGDPDYIIQDALLLTPTVAPEVAYQNNDQTAGIIYDYGEIYANVNFKVPQDINLSTGTPDLSFAGDDTAYKRNVFSGQYRVLRVTNKINKGLFTQQLEMMRYIDSHNVTPTSYVETVQADIRAKQLAAAHALMDDHHETISAAPTAEQKAAFSSFLTDVTNAINIITEL